MYRLLIIDDETHIVEQLHNCINWEQLNIEIIGEASNGLEGLSISMEKEPDIVICDIRMPLMDGISFATEFQRHFPNSQIIFLSGYSDRNYMQNAIRLKVVDYIFKPFGLSDLLSAIEKALINLHMLAPAQKNQQNDNLLLELLHVSDTPDKLNDFIKSSHIKTDFNLPYICMLVRFNSGISFSKYRQGNITGSIEIQHMIISSYLEFENRINLIFDGKYVMSKVGDNYLIYVNIPNQDLLSDELMDKINELLTLVNDANITIGVSPIYTSSESIKTAFQKARQAALSGFLTGSNKVISFYSSRIFSPDHEARNQFITELKKRNISNAANSLSDYFTYISNCAPEYIPAIREDLLNIAILLKNELKSPPFHLISEFINHAASLDDIWQYINCLMNQYITEISSIDNHSRIIFEAEQYILQHLGDSLSLKEIADNVFVSHTYLCFLYKKQTGKTINQFILDARMQKAKRLLLDTNKKIGDIASSLGYANQNYFTKTFASYFGSTPSNFRK